MSNPTPDLNRGRRSKPRPAATGGADPIDVARPEPQDAASPSAGAAPVGWAPTPESFVARQFRLRESENETLMELQRTLKHTKVIDTMRYILTQLVPAEIERLRREGQ